MDVKKCAGCNDPKPLNEFTKDGRGYYCLECQRGFGKKHYQNNKAYYKKKARKRDKELREWFRDYKRGLKCQCGEDHPACIEFHHTESDEKDTEITDAVSNGWRIERILEEIAKCIVVCSNCHRKLHWEARTGAYRFLKD